MILGILYLAFQAFPIIFMEGHGFNVQSTGMSFLGIGLGMVIALCSQPFWNRYAALSYINFFLFDNMLQLGVDYLHARLLNTTESHRPRSNSSKVKSEQY